jgi:hypothetical protein
LADVEAMRLNMPIVEEAITLDTDSGTEFATRITTGGVGDLLS